MLIPRVLQSLMRVSRIFTAFSCYFGSFIDILALFGTFYAFKVEDEVQ